MTVALNGRFTGEARPTGTHTSALHLYDAIVRSPRRCDVVVFADRRHRIAASWAEVPGTEVVHVPFRDWGRVRSQLWERRILPKAAVRRGCTVAHHPINTCPPPHRGLAQTVTFHDLNVVHHPEWTGRLFGAWLRRVVLPSVVRAAHVVTVSDYVLSDLRSTLGIPVARSSRIHNGVPPRGARSGTGSSGEVGEVREVGDAGRPVAPAVVLGVNLWQPHKNLDRLVTAVAGLRADGRDVRLRLVGRPQANYRRTGTSTGPGTGTGAEAPPWVDVLGYLDDDALAREYAAADVVAYPSLSEGFGLPVLEALASGTRVVASRTTSLPEVAGPAGVLADPCDPASIATGIAGLLDETGPERRAREEAGRAWAAGFTWERAAAAYVDLFASLGATRREAGADVSVDRPSLSRGRAGRNAA